MTDKGVPVGKRYRIVTNHQEMAHRIHARFSQCVCTCDHAAFNEIDWHDTEKYNEKICDVFGSNSVSCKEQFELNPGYCVGDYGVAVDDHLLVSFDRICNWSCIRLHACNFRHHESEDRSVFW